jgi:hypothetical protein
MTLPGFTADWALVHTTTVWSGRTRAVLDTAAVRTEMLPGGTYCGPCPPSSGPGMGGYYWCCSPTPNGGTECRAYSCDLCAGLIHICARNFCICNNTPNDTWIPMAGYPCGGYCQRG